jgi:outer membrane autotransporter protein
MKIFILTTFIASIFTTSVSLAKTSGSYLGIDVVGVNAQHQYKDGNTTIAGYSNFGGEVTPVKSFSDLAIGYGANYKYAFSFNKLLAEPLNRIFIAPEIFFEKLETKAKNHDGAFSRVSLDESASLHSRYGAKINFGADIADKFAAYLTGGVGIVSYTIDWKGSTVNGYDKTTSGSQLGFLMGAGMAYEISKNFIISLEYSRETLNLKAPEGIYFGNQESNRLSVRTKLDVVKLGAAYHF